MNTTLPPARDLPPGRHAEIRDAVERAITGRRPARRHAAVLAAAAAVVALAVVLTPDVSRPAEDALDPAQSAPTAAKADLSPQRVAEIEAGCSASARISPPARLYQYREDAAGKYAVLYTSGYLLPCTVDGPFVPFDSGYLYLTALDWLPGYFSVDHTGGTSGGRPLGDDKRPDPRAWRVAVGRVGTKVARVTYTYDGTTVDATIADGTYLARIVYPSKRELPYDGTTGEVRAYDRNGRFLGTSADIARQCYLRPDGAVVYGSQFSSDPATCVPALPWR